MPPREGGKHSFGQAAASLEATAIGSGKPGRVPTLPVPNDRV